MGGIRPIFHLYMQAQEWKRECSFECPFQTLLSVLEAKLLGFHALHQLYKEDPDFQEFIQGEIKSSPFTLHEGYLCKGNNLCVPHRLR